MRVANRRPPEGFDPWGRSWSVTLSYRGRRLTAPFFTGSAHKDPPDPCEVLETLLGEAGTVENSGDWRDWADELGYDPEDPPRDLRRIYARTVRQTEKLRNFLGDDYDTLVFPKEMEDVKNWCRGTREL